jgi:hypothetical protein
VDLFVDNGTVKVGGVIASKEPTVQTKGKSYHEAAASVAQALRSHFDIDPSDMKKAQSWQPPKGDVPGVHQHRPSMKHRYVMREPDGKDGFRYHYGDESMQPHANGKKPSAALKKPRKHHPGEQQENQAMQKSAAGDHKYKSRKPDGKGGWIYEYEQRSMKHRAQHGSRPDEVSMKHSASQGPQSKHVYRSPEEEAHQRRGTPLTYSEERQMRHIANQASREARGVSEDAYHKETIAAHEQAVIHHRTAQLRHDYLAKHADSADDRRDHSEVAAQHGESVRRHRQAKRKIADSYREHPMKKSNAHDYDPNLRKQFRQNGTDALSKGLYKFAPYGGAKMAKLDAEYLPAYLDAFIEEAYEHEACEKAHGENTMGSMGDQADYWSQFVYSELVAYLPTNPNLAAACKLLSVDKQYVAQRIRDLALL